jgi:peptide-methionine (R)-S-oxide reductase
VTYDVQKSDEQWRNELSAQRYAVLRKAHTEAPFTGSLLHVDAQGVFSCAGCAHILFTSDEKFDSGTGWPSFSAPVAEENIRTRKDTSMFMERVAVACKQCDAHLGHVFTDGPEPTGLRYCINESSLRFVRFAA